MQPLQLDNIAALDLTVTEERCGRPMELAIDDIDEDPAQPRSEFFAETLQELADSIAARGVLQPVSVRRHRERPGRWTLNFGARRLRAAKMAGRQTIPAFEDEGADSYDQVIENEQRERLKPLDLALFIQRRQAMGESQADIARRMSKSRNYVMVASALIDAPAWLLTVYREGRCRSMNALHELRRLHAEQPARVEEWAAGRDVITREMLLELRVRVGCTGAIAIAGACLDLPSESPQAFAPLESATPPEALSSSRPVAVVSGETGGATTHVPTTNASEIHTVRRSASLSTNTQRLRLQAVLDGSPVWIVTERVPDDVDALFVQPVGLSTFIPVAAVRLELVGLRAD